jgi:FkbM family methyltransferase
MIVIDIGANLGYFTLLMCGLVGNDKGKVYSIEANPYVFQLLRDSVAVNGQLSKVKLLNYAIYKEECSGLQFTFGDNGSTNGRIKNLKANPDKFNSDEKMVKVKGNTLDNLIPENEKIDFIKVDIEGAEEMFWYGSKRVRKDNDELKILLEYNPNRYDNPKLFVNSIVDEGYQLKLVGKSEEYDKVLTGEELLSIPSNVHVMLLLEKV